MAIKRMDHVGIVVEDLDGAIAFFRELGMEVEGGMPVEGAWVDGVLGLDGVRVEMAMLRTPDGQGKVELSTFHHPAATGGEPAPPNRLGYLNVMFLVDDIDDTVARLRARGGELVGEVVQYETMYRLCYLRGPAGIIVALAEEVG